MAQQPQPNMKPEADRKPAPEAMPPQLPASLHGAAVERFDGLEPVVAIPRELAGQNWHVGKVAGKHSIDDIRTCAEPPCLVVTSSLNGPPGQPKPADRRFTRVCVPMANLKDWQLEE